MGSVKRLAKSRRDEQVIIMSSIPRWEYMTLFVRAEAEREMDFLQSNWSWKNGIPRNTPQAMIPELNSLGDQGWELVHMQPVMVGNNADVLIADPSSGSRSWTSTYFCVFKRVKEG
jgi:hypothetical protein